MSTGYPRLAMPPCDRRTREYQAVAATRDALERRLGPTPSFDSRQAAEQILRTAFDIAMLQRQRHEEGALNTRNHELLVRRENSLARLLERLERLAPAPTQPSLADRIAARRASQAVPA